MSTQASKPSPKKSAPAEYLQVVGAGIYDDNDGKEFCGFEADA